MSATAVLFAMLILNLISFFCSSSKFCSSPSINCQAVSFFALLLPYIACSLLWLPFWWRYRTRELFSIKKKVLLLLSLTRFSLTPSLPSLSFFTEHKEDYMLALENVSDVSTSPPHPSFVIKPSQQSVFSSLYPIKSLPSVSSLSLFLHIFLRFHLVTIPSASTLNLHTSSTLLLSRIRLPFILCKKNAKLSSLFSTLQSSHWTALSVTTENKQSSLQSSPPQTGLSRESCSV